MLRKQKDLKKKRQRVARGVRRHLQGLPDKPRISVFRSNRQFYCQAIDDTKGRTLAAISSMAPVLKSEMKVSQQEKAKIIGLKLADHLKELGIERAVFDRGWYKYHGCIKTFADAVREGGIKF